MTIPTDTPISATRETPPPRRGSGPFFRLFLILVVAGLVLCLAAVWLIHKTTETAAETLTEVTENFRPNEIVTTFNEWYELQTEATDGNILEVATARSSEHFSRTSNVAMFGRVLPGTTTVSEITVPATYRFHIDLDGAWNVFAEGNRLLVIAPPVRPSLPVAFDTGGVRKKTQSGWARWDGEENLAALEKEITGKLAERAGQPATLDKIREESRVAVARFVRTWLLEREAWAEGRFEEIVVVFAGEDDKIIRSEPASLRLVDELDSVGGTADPP
ncbi:MAG: hypothetical protein GXX91_17665 [Verrucomicrobiaceae bacterium]|nr:hypothetical protein [Verrucomicrobiaceae bacterium]